MSKQLIVTIADGATEAHVAQIVKLLGHVNGVAAVGDDVVAAPDELAAYKLFAEDVAKIIADPGNTGKAFERAEAFLRARGHLGDAS